MIKKQNKEILALTSNVESLKAALQESHAEIDKEKTEIDNQRSINASLVAELESVRALILSAEQRARKLENENGEMVARFIAEKEKMAAQMNDMNNMVEGMRGFVGSGLSFMKVSQTLYALGITCQFKFSFQLSECAEYCVARCSWQPFQVSCSS